MVDSTRKNLRTPISSESVRSLRAGDIVLISGNIVTGRDRIHRFLVEHAPLTSDIPFNLSGSILYHCGPIMKKAGNTYNVISAGPTTSMRLEMYEASVIKSYGIKGIMGKGGMGTKTMQALVESACVYFHAIGGAAVYLADRIKKTLGVWKLEEFGPTEAMWQFEVEDFPAIVSMDSIGNDIHREIENASFNKFAELIGK